MRNPIAQNVKQEIARLWLAGNQRDKIAVILKVSTGTTSNVIAEFENLIGAPTADTLRVLATELRLHGITALECAKGFRFLNQLNSYGISLDKLIPFVTSINEKCLSSSISADQIFDVCQQILELNESVPITRLPHFISEQIKRKQELECDLAELKGNMDKLRIEELELFDQLSTTRYDLEEYQQTVKKFESCGLVLHDDTRRISNFLENLDKCGGDANEVFRVLGDIRNCKTFHINLQLKVSALKSSLRRKGDELQSIDQKLASGNQLLSQYKELEKLGIGLSDLKRIHDIITDIASGNFLNPEVAFRNFTNDILKNYDTMVGIEARTLEIKEILSASQQKYLALEADYSKKMDVYNKTADLLDQGIQPFEILQLCEIIRVSRIKFSRIKQDLDRYANLTNAADQIESRVEKLGDEAHDLFLRVDSLKAEEFQISQGLIALHEKHDAIERDLSNA